jgi:hypothetical protein
MAFCRESSALVPTDRTSVTPSKLRVSGSNPDGRATSHAGLRASPTLTQNTDTVFLQPRKRKRSPAEVRERAAGVNVRNVGHGPRGERGCYTIALILPDGTRIVARAGVVVAVEALTERPNGWEYAATRAYLRTGIGEGR